MENKAENEIKIKTCPHCGHEFIMGDGFAGIAYCNNCIGMAMRTLIDFALTGNFPGRIKARGGMTIGG